MPPSSVTGKPTAKIESCGEARFRIPIARFSVSSVAIIGSESRVPAENTIDPALATAPQPWPESGVPAMGSAVKLSTSTASIIRWPSRTMNSSIATMFRKRDSTMVCPPEERS
ncbi:hypothetical protein D3C72_1010170 [compost metagenome]